MTRDPTRIVNQLQSEVDNMRSKLDTLKQAVRSGNAEAVKSAAMSLRFAQSGMRRKTRDLKSNRVVIPPGLVGKERPGGGRPGGGRLGGGRR